MQWKSHTLVLLCLKPSQLLLLVLSESCVCFSLTHFRPKSLSSQLFGLTSSSSSSWTGLDCGGWRREESSYSSHSHLVHCLLSSCCVALGEPCFPIYCILLWVEWHLLAVVFVLFFKLLTCSCHSHDSPSPEGYQQPLWCCTLPQSDKCPRVCVWECVRTQCYLHVIRVGNER